MATKKQAIDDKYTTINGAVLSDKLLKEIAYLQGDSNETINSGIEILSDAASLLSISSEKIEDSFIEQLRTVVIELSYIREFHKLLRKPVDTDK